MDDVYLSLMTRYQIWPPKENFCSISVPRSSTLNFMGIVWNLFSKLPIEIFPVHTTSEVIAGDQFRRKLIFLHFFKLVTKESLEQISSPSIKFSFPVNLFKKTHAWTRSKLCWLSKFSISRLWVTTCQVILLEKLKCRPLQASCTYFAHDRP